MSARCRLPLELVLGGTFDPVHEGHLSLAETLRRLLDLPRVLLLPASLPPHKDAASVTAAPHRLAMLRLAVAGREGLQISSLELERNEVCYTIDSLRRLRDEPPGCSPVFVMGRDSLLEIPTWRDYRELMAEFDLLVIARPGTEPLWTGPGLDPAARRRLQPEVTAERGREALTAAGLGRGGRVFPVGMPTPPISSSQIRALVRAGARPVGLVPSEVAEYIQKHGLYRREDRS